MSKRAERETTEAEKPWIPAIARELIVALDLLDEERGTERFWARLRVIGHPLWVPDRPARIMPPVWELARYWAERGEPFTVDLDAPHCFACWVQPRYSGSTPQQKWSRTRPALERSHLVNWARHGLDGPQNLVPLCSLCNRTMPIFDIDHAADAIAWVLAGGSAAAVMERLERRRRAAGGKRRRGQRLRRASSGNDGTAE